MSEGRHTEGPWEIGRHPAMSAGFIIKPVLFGWRVRVLPQSEGGHVVILNGADARLIAAAPDLLAWLKAAQVWLDFDGRFDMHGINAAIAKAEGHTP